jgi:hypothetical protein
VEACSTDTTQLNGCLTVALKLDRVIARRRSVGADERSGEAVECGFASQLSDQFGLSFNVGPEDLRDAVGIAELAGVVERPQGSDFSGWKGTEGVSLIVHPPLTIRLNDDEPVRLCHVHPAIARAPNYATAKRVPSDMDDTRIGARWR